MSLICINHYLNAYPVYSSFAIGKLLYNFADDGIANILGLETLRHGTNLLSNLSIRVSGGKPQLGAKLSGSSKGYSSILEQKSVNYFFLFKDSESKLTIDNPCLYTRIVYFPLTLNGAASRILSLRHTYMSGYNLVYSNVMGKKDPYYNPGIYFLAYSLGIISEFINTLVSPALRFRFSKIDPHQMENDPEYSGLAYRTQHIVEPWRLGILGSLSAGVNLDWFSRARARPLKILTGVMQLACAAALASFARDFLKDNLYPALAGAILA